MKSIIPINDDITLVLRENNINHKVQKALEIQVIEEYGDYKIKSYNLPIKSNVAIASAITAYARIHMHQYINNNTLYCDTDSIITSQPLPNHLIGKELGQMKNELEGMAVNGQITRGIFLGLKNYGYQFIDKETGATITKSVWAGIKRDSLSWQDLENLSIPGATLEKEREDVFYSSLSKLSVTVKNSTIIKITANAVKPLINNIYQPQVLALTGGTPIATHIKFTLQNLFNRIKKVKDSKIINKIKK